MPFVRKPTRKRKLKNLFRILIVLAGVLFLGWLYYLLITSGPRRVEDGSRRPALTSDVTSSEAARESLRLEESFNERIAGKDRPSAEDLAVLKEAAARQREVTHDLARASPRDHQRLDQLNRRIVDFEAAVIASESRRLEAQAKLARDTGNLETALNTLDEAHRLQRQINREMGGSRYRDSFREAYLSREAGNWRAQPIHEESEALETQARQAAAAEEWDVATLRFRDALERQQRVNNDFPGTRFASATRAERLSGEISSLQTAEVMARINTLREDGEALMTEGSHPEAWALFAQAIDLQRETNRDFPGSRYASTSRVTELEALRQSALSGTLSQRIEEAVGEMVAALGEGRTAEGIQSLERAVAASNQLASDYPRSRYIDHDRQLRLAYLSSVSGELVALHDRLNTNLLKIPGEEGLQMYRKEVPQSLYTTVMNRNPSRNQGANLPVDSVSWAEAHEFCRRLSWILGRPVRLPTQEEFERAAGPYSELDLADMTWNMRNSDGVSQAVGSKSPNAHGFHDLVGNLGEWLDTTLGNGQALVIGGNYDDLFDDVDTLPTRSANINERSRTIGFRFVVEG